MKKRLGVFLLLFILLFANVTISMAAEAVTLSTDETSIKAGEEFKITISQNYGTNIGAIEGDITYDEKAFQLKGNTTTGNWTNLNGGNVKLFSVLPNGDISTGAVAELTFVALSNVSDSKITLSNIKIYDESSNIVEEPAEQSISFTVTGGTENTKALTGITITNQPTTTTYTEGAIFDPSGMEITATYSDGTMKAVTNYTYSPSESLTTNDKSVTISYTENGVTRTITLPITVNAADNGNAGQQSNGQVQSGSTTTSTPANTTNTTSADTTTTTASSLPKTGSKTLVIAVVVLGLIAVGIVCYKQYEKYKEI